MIFCLTFDFDIDYAIEKVVCTTFDIDFSYVSHLYNNILVSTELYYNFHK